MILILKIKKVLLYLLPYGIVERRFKKRKKALKSLSFECQYQLFLKSKKRKEFLSNYEELKVVSIEGTGFSGSSAVVDLLREYNKTICIGAVSDETENADDVLGHFEVDFLRLAGGLFEIEHYIETNNVFQNDAMIHRFIKMAEAFPVFIEKEEVRDSFFRFFHAIIHDFICDMNYPCYNSFLYEKNNAPYHIYYLKKMPLAHYRNIACKFVSELLNLIRCKSKILVLDQFCNDFTGDIQKYLGYIPGLKIIYVYRDPRDIYEYAILSNVEWIAHANVENYISWFKMMTSHYTIQSNENQLYVRFEELINNYEEEKNRIENFLNFSNDDHLYEGKFFNPMISKANVSIWKKDSQRKSDFDSISSEIGYFCYE